MKEYIVVFNIFIESVSCLSVIRMGLPRDRGFFSFIIGRFLMGKVSSSYITWLLSSNSPWPISFNDHSRFNCHLLLFVIISRW